MGLGGSIHSSPVISPDGVVYIGNSGGHLFAVIPGEQEGGLAWNFAADGSIEASPALGPDGTIYFGTGQGSFYAVNPDGHKKWSYATGGSIVGSAAVGADGTIYVGSTDGYLYAFAPDGSVRWAFATGYSIDGTPAIGPDGTIYIGNEFHRFFAISPDGSENWHLDLRESVVGAPAIDVEGTIYINDGWSGIIALHPNGIEKWFYRMEAMRFTTAPIIGDDGHIYVGNSDGKLYVIGSAAPRIVSVQPRTGIEAQEVTFSAAVAGPRPLQYHWDFGGGAWPDSSDLQSPTVLLQTVGVYAASLQVSNLYGEDVYCFDLRVKSPRLNWWMYGREPKHQRCSPVAGPESPAVKWSVDTGSAICSSPVVGDDGTIYVGNTDGILQAIAPDGSSMWSVSVGKSIDSTPAVTADGTVYVGAVDNRLVAVDSEGNIKWTFLAGSYIRSSPVIGIDGTIYFGSSDGNLYALSPEGEELWRFHTEMPVTSSPAIGDDGAIYVGSQDGSLYVIYPDGSEKWRFTVEGVVRDSPTIGDDGTIYVPILMGLGAAGAPNLFAIDPQGNEKWRINYMYWVGGFPGYSPLSAVAIGPSGTIYVGNVGVHAISPDGETFWAFDIPHTEEQSVYSTRAAPVVDVNGVIYWPSYYAVYNPVTFEWSFEGLLFALNPDGTEKWRLTTSTVGEAVNSSSPAIGDDGTIYLGSEDGYLYAIGEAD